MAEDGIRVAGVNMMDNEADALAYLQREGTRSLPRRPIRTAATGWSGV